ncbi:hypothetical protein [Rhodohalobacter sulfatireducens]|uniref:Uncharacterized protein n=1 Tax=Rhodohalobacter sulfatireducens TaxID=2911366 RepID=A0ABS9KD94_9BACT|nr:hypothetical protein [Rhodohalobacter sulfatireducens]MCG2588819.1 hypothetical protein [Rhodohalobacter sulfatireducens]
MSLTQRRSVWELDALTKPHHYPGDYICGHPFFENLQDASDHKIYSEELFPGFDALFIQRRYSP